MRENENESANDGKSSGAVESDPEMTGLPWPKTWKGAYLLVIGSFIFWLLLLIILTESFA